MQPAVPPAPAGAPAPAPAGAPAGAKAGAPAGAKAGAPAGAKAGAPAVAKAGPPEGAKAGAPEGAKAGASEGAAAGAKEPAPAPGTVAATSGKEAAADETIPYPKAVYFIIGNEFCERFSFYGMRTVLTLFLVNVLLFEERTAKTVFHAFVMTAYFTPVLGAMIADAYLGKFKTIFYISIIYALGNITLAVSATPALVSQTWIPMLGLVVIAFGTGGIKPCVSAFGGDQFLPGQEKHLEQFFSLFYIAINAGSLLSTYLTPILRVQRCLGQISCFPLAFGVPAALMVIALVLFLIGKPLYRIVPPAGNVVLQVIQCMSHALMAKMRGGGEKREHWLDYADDQFDKKVISDIKDVLHVLVLYLPLPLFWALFDQQGSQWTLQANRMDGEILGYQVLPDQMQLANPLLILILVPMFSYLFYPMFERCNFLNKPLQRITVGGLAAAAAFSIAGGLDLILEGATDPAIPEGHAKVTFVNTLPCAVTGTGGSFNRRILPGMVHREAELAVPQSPLTFAAEAPCETQPGQYEDRIESGGEYTVFLFATETKAVRVGLVRREEGPISHGAGVSVAYTLNEPLSKVMFTVEGATGGPLLTIAGGNATSGFTNISSLTPSSYMARLVDGSDHEIVTCDLTAKNGGQYVVVATQAAAAGSPVNCSIVDVVKPHTVSMFLQLPQYILITMGEVMFSITGLEFSYSQAPSSMKSVLQAAWLVTVAMGNLIVVVVAEARFFQVASAESFMYSGLMALDMVVFGIMASYYKYIEPAANPHKEEEAAAPPEKSLPAPEKPPAPAEGDVKP